MVGECPARWRRVHPLIVRGARVHMGRVLIAHLMSGGLERRSKTLAARTTTQAEAVARTHTHTGRETVSVAEITNHFRYWWHSLMWMLLFLLWPPLPDRRTHCSKAHKDTHAQTQTESSPRASLLSLRVFG